MISGDIRVKLYCQRRNADELHGQARGRTRAYKGQEN